KPALEARDILGILSTSSTLIQGHTIVVSGDSSLHMVPGWFYDPERHASGETMFINKIDADLAFYRRVLEGDADNQVPGCPGMNPETTGRLLSAFKDDEALWLDENWTWHRHVWEAVVEAFRKAGQSESEALLQARLIRVLREPDYSWDTEEVH
ncbi:MAG: hypothetical protein GWM98_24255, partial [Nitrospinaceae bacterium]|nr:hypothetical protein [Nitrospinaceae bacterium]NIR57005.1 hypothetical protein [Nitrospinaceae bacterium]NIS87462.1 hypothetical protein [Nitrospinaceae bacterium]NIT84311.1 hypothetical protein [Nitrospinaceae bacterium]NIU46501.1 hypothetical protein [Nitrospinaceae bacterium]